MDTPKNSKFASLLIMRIAIVIIVAGIFLAVALHQIYSGLPREETKAEKMARYRIEANRTMLEYCTNWVVGFNHAVSVYLDDSSDDPHNWKGEVVAEYVNHLGGIDRTNFSFPFEMDSLGGRDFIKIDTMTMAKREVEVEAKQKELELQQRLNRLK